ncbi:MAG: hypothetical protein JWL76_744 [Thermoleophilia bacterium]|nr:hypothetical protein [Thermoleophilia bacterium]
MSGIAATGAENERPLVDQLLDIAGTVNTSAYFADGEYIPQMSRESELERAFIDSMQAGLALEHIAPRIAALDGGEDGLQLAKQALNYIASGRMVLRDGVAVEHDLVRGGTLVEDAIATRQAGSMFRDAESKVRGIADMALLESLTPDQVFNALANRG